MAQGYTASYLVKSGNGKDRVYLAEDYDALAAELVAAKRHIWRSGAGEAFNRIDVLEALLKRWYADPGVYMNDEELKTQQALIDDTVRALSSEQETEVAK